MPFYGMEKAATQLMIGLQKSGAIVSATVVSGDVPAQARGLDLDPLGIRKSALRLGTTVPHLRRRLTRLPADVHIVASGLWASAPVGLALVGTGRSFVSWEHSLLRERLQLDRRVKMLSRIVHCLPVRPWLTVAVSGRSRPRCSPYVRRRPSGGGLERRGYARRAAPSLEFGLR